MKGELWHQLQAPDKELVRQLHQKVQLLLQVLALQ
jgi:hypothetical protein